MIKQISDAENAATSLEADITAAIENIRNPALPKKHATLAGSWAKKLNLKKGFVMKTKTLASTARAEVFDKKGNKFEEGLNVSEALIDEWNTLDLNYHAMQNISHCFITLLRL